MREEADLDCAVELDERLVEISAGQWEGLTRDDIEAAAPGVIGVPGWFCRTPGGESYEALAGRLTGWLEEARQDGARRVVVSHGAAGRVLRQLYAGLPSHEAWTSPAPPQDAVFLMHEGVVGRVDEGFEG